MNNKIIYDKFSLKIECYHFNNNNFELYETFSNEGTFNTNLLSYSFQKNINDFSGSFSFVLKENTGTKADLFMDVVQLLDMVRIYEHDNLVFIGIISRINFAANSGNLQKNVSVMGESIESLLERCFISTDVTAMAGIDGNAEQLKTIMSLNNGSEPLTIKEAGKTIYDAFGNITDKYKSVATTYIKKMLESSLCYGNANFETWLTSESDNLKFKFPISSNMWNTQEVNFIKFLRQLLPEMVYEFYGKLIDEKPKIVIRECPFDSNVWNELPLFKVDPIFIISYNLSKNNSQVYTAFMSYVAGSPVDPEWSKKLDGTIRGYESAARNEEKIAKYGYKTLSVQWIGYFEKTPNSTISKSYQDLNKRLNSWYGNLEDLYTGDITIANTTHNVISVKGLKANKKIKNPAIGERLQIGKNQFYVTSENHSWNYGGTPIITYSIDRGGEYTSSGEWKPCSRISQFLGEFKK